MSLDARRPATTSERLECLALTATLAVAAVNPGTGYLSGYFLAIVVSLGIWLRHVRTWQSDTIDVLAAVAVAVTLLSPYWHAETSALTSQSHGAAMSLVFFVAVRITVRSAPVFRELVTQVGFVCVLYALYFLANAASYGFTTNRAALEFANANYTGAVLAFGGAVTLYLAYDTTALVRAGWLVATAVQVAAIYQTGSRASFAGLVLAGLALLVWRRAPRLVFVGTFVTAVVGFVLALVPGSIELFARAARGLAYARAFQRSDTSAADASGRAETWDLALRHVDDALVSGWGPGNYYVPIGADPSFGAHSWGLEYLLSVGLLGTVLIGAVLVLAFRAGRAGAGGLWTAATTLALLPSLVLSTHQWTLWAWLAFALWSRADVLTRDRPEPLESAAPSRSERTTRAVQ